jgi:hypothetical protein
MKFERYKPPVARSFSLRAFNNYETEINEHYWSFQVMSDFSGYLARQAAKKNGSTDTATVFHASGPDARRIPPTVNKWITAQSELENWLRNSALVSAAAFHEAYVRQVVRSALMSDPFCRFGLSRIIDGVKILKSQAELSYAFELESMTRGDWNARSAAFERIFSAPPGTIGDLSKLEEIRKLRNDYAHGFGRELNPPTPTEFKIKPSQRLSATRFRTLLGAMSKSAASIDKFLLHNHIGAFEIIYHYDSFLKAQRDSNDKRYDEDRAFQRTLNRDLGLTLSTEYCVEVKKYYLSV